MAARPGIRGSRGPLLRSLLTISHVARDADHVEDDSGTHCPTRLHGRHPVSQPRDWREDDVAWPRCHVAAPAADIAARELRRVLSPEGLLRVFFASKPPTSAMKM